MHLIGVDIGATFIKSALLDLDKLEVMHRGGCPFPPFEGGLPDGVKEVPFHDIKDAVLGQALRLSDAAYPSPSGFVVCGQMGGSIVGDRFVSWMDRRSGIDGRNTSVIAEAVARWLGWSLVGPVVGDQQCALVGAGLRPGELSLNISTGSQVSVIYPSNEIEPKPPMPWQTRPYFDGQFIKCITHLPAGRALNALLRLLREMSGLEEETAWRYVVEVVSGRKHTDLRWNLSFWPSAVGEEGHLLGILEDNLDVGGLFLAAFRAMAETYKEMAGKLGAVDLPIVFSGGLARRLEKLREVIADEFGCSQWRMSPDPDETLTGLLTLGLAWTGRAKSVAKAVEMVRGHGGKNSVHRNVECGGDEAGGGRAVGLDGQCSEP